MRKKFYDLLCSYKLMESQVPLLLPEEARRKTMKVLLARYLDQQQMLEVEKADSEAELDKKEEKESAPVSSKR